MAVAADCSFIVESERERHSRRCLFHFAGCQSRNAIADIMLGHGLKIVEVCRAGVGYAILSGQQEFGWNTADRGCDGRYGDRIQD
jgi:hypothetical protein